MTCVISGKADADGRYCLVVTQSPNRSTYKVEFSDADHAVVFDSAGTRLYELEAVLSPAWVIRPRPSHLHRFRGSRPPHTYRSSTPEHRFVRCARLHGWPRPLN